MKLQGLHETPEVLDFKWRDGEFNHPGDPTEKYKKPEVALSTLKECKALILKKYLTEDIRQINPFSQKGKMGTIMIIGKQARTRLHVRIKLPASKGTILLPTWDLPVVSQSRKYLSKSIEWYYFCPSCLQWSPPESHLFCETLTVCL